MPITDKEKRKKYYRAKRCQSVKLHLNTKERTILQTRMNKEGWENTSGFIKYCLFGDDPDYKYKKLLEENNPEQMSIVLNTMVHDIMISLNYFQFRYEKDMRQLYREEGVDLRAWVKATYEPHVQTIQLLSDVYGSLRQIADHFGIEIRGVQLNPLPEDFDYSNKENLDKIAQELYDKGLLEIGKWDFTQR